MTAIHRDTQRARQAESERKEVERETETEKERWKKKRRERVEAGRRPAARVEVAAVPPPLTKPPQLFKRRLKRREGKQLK